MTTKSFSINEALKFGWQTMISRLSAVFLYIVLPSLVACLCHFAVNKMIGRVNLIWAFVLMVPVIILQIVVALGILRVAVKLLENEQPTYALFRSRFGTIMQYIGASILFSLACGLGVLVFIIPGIIIFIMFQFYNFLIADQGLGVGASLERSSEITRCVRWKLFLFSLACTGIHLLGFLFFIIGIIPAAMVTFLATAHVYRQLLNASVKPIAEQQPA